MPGILTKIVFSLVLCSFVMSVGSPGSSETLTADQMADMVLTSARKAHNDKNYPFAVTRFREFLSRFGNHKDVPAAHYGLALALLELPERDYQGAVEQLQPLSGDRNFPDYPRVVYYLGRAQRGLGTRELAQAAAKPNEAPQRRATANQKFEEAGRQFAAALDAFIARAKADKPNSPEQDADWDWAGRARCELAEMQLRTSKAKEALATALPFLQEAPWNQNPARARGHYLHGFASFQLQDYPTALRSLATVAPYQDREFGNHARYLLARAHHLRGEKPEAAGHYEGVLADFEKVRKEAPAALQRPEVQKDSHEKARLEELIKGPPPDHVARAAFFVGVLQYEDGKFAEALARFAQFPQQYPTSPLLSDAQLRQGFCQVRLRQFPAAVQTLQPLADKEPGLGDQATYWLGKAQVGAADPNNKPAYEQALKTAMDTFRRAADRAQQLIGTDPDAKITRGEILLDLADAQQQLRMYREAAGTYTQLLNEKVLPAREDETRLRLAGAYHLAEDYANADQVCQQFQQSHPQSPLLPAVLFRFAENAYFSALAADKVPNRAGELPRLNDEILARYKAVLDKFPDFPLANQARYGMAMGHYRKGEFDKARAILESIPAKERNGDLALASYALADIVLRSFAPKEDGKAAVPDEPDKLHAAQELLETFVAAQPQAAQAADALLKIGYCHQRLARVAAKPEEKAKLLANARAAYERLMQQFPNHLLHPLAVYERAHCLVQTGDVNGAVAELQRFQNDPLKATPAAPLAVLQLATIWRGQNKPADAANALLQCRQFHEPILLATPQKVGWAALLLYHQGLAVQEGGKFAEARTLFDQVARQHPTRPEAPYAALHSAQCFKEEGLQKIAAARQSQANSPQKENDPAAKNLINEGLNFVRQGIQPLEAYLPQIKPPTAEARARVLYELAWEHRTVAEFEVAEERARLREEEWKKLKDKAAKEAPQGSSPPEVPPPDIPIATVTTRPSEQKAHGFYQALIDGFPNLPLAIDARFELAELLVQRGESDPGIKLLTDALDKNPSGELAERIRLRLGACYAAKGDTAGALKEFDQVVQNPQSPHAAQAHYRAGECLLTRKEWDAAAKRLAVFRDQAAFQNIAGLSDRALLRLGHALAHAGQWEPSRQAFELLANRFGTSPWLHEARYGIGWAWENQKQYDQAVNAYAQVVSATAGEVAAKAQLQIGLCRLAQGRFAEASTALLIVPYTYDYAELNAVALCEAARALGEQKQPDQAAHLLRRVIQDHPKSDWAKIAQERLAGLKAGSP